MSDAVKGFYVDHVSPPEYLCARGQRVLAERCVQIVDVHPSISKDDIQSGFTARGLHPSKVLKDNKIKNAKALNRSVQQDVSWIVEFAGTGIILKRLITRM